MPKHHSEAEIYSFITGDFRCAWDALAAKSIGEAGSRGNFLFALQAMILVEWLGRLCSADGSGKATENLAAELHKIEPRYFAELDDKCPPPGFPFPGLPGKDPLKSLLAALWDLVRNGQAHQYQDIIVRLACGKQWVLLIRGALPGMTLAEVAKHRVMQQHLDYAIEKDGDLTLTLHPGVLFLDVETAAHNAKLLSRGLTITHFGRTSGKNYNYDLPRLEAALNKGGLKKV